jgi:hypothetical protein
MKTEAQNYVAFESDRYFSKAGMSNASIAGRFLVDLIGLYGNYTENDVYALLNLTAICEPIV